MSKKKVRQGQSRWIVQTTQIVHPATKPPEHTLQRVEVIGVHKGNVIFKMGALENTSSWPLAEFLKVAAETYRQGCRVLLEAQARA